MPKQHGHGGRATDLRDLQGSGIRCDSRHAQKKGLLCISVAPSCAGMFEIPMQAESPWAYDNDRWVYSKGFEGRMVKMLQESHDAVGR